LRHWDGRTEIPGSESLRLLVMEDVPMIKKIRDYSAKHYPDVKYRSLNYLVTFTSAKIFVECLRKADAAGQLNGDGWLMLSSR